MKTRSSHDWGAILAVNGIHLPREARSDQEFFEMLEELFRKRATEGSPEERVEALVHLADLMHDYGQPGNTYLLDAYRLQAQEALKAGGNPSAPFRILLHERGPIAESCKILASRTYTTREVADHPPVPCQRTACFCRLIKVFSWSEDSSDEPR